MASLNNINNIIINGNDVCRISKHYNANSEVKTKSLATLRSTEEAIIKNKVECNYEFNKQHELNVMYGVINVDKSTNIDTTYGMSVKLNEENKTFVYKSTNLKNITVDTIYLSKYINVDGVIYTLEPDFKEKIQEFTRVEETDYYVYRNSSYTTYVYYINSSCFKENEGVVIDTNYNKFSDFYKDIAYTIPATEDDFIQVSGVIYIPKDKLYVRMSKNIYINTSSIKIYLYNHIEIGGQTSTTVNKIIISDKVPNIGIYIYTTVSPVTIYCGAVNLCYPSFANFTVEIFINKSYKECMLGNNSDANIQGGSNSIMHLTGDYFDNEDLDNAYELAVTKSDHLFGDYNHAYIGKIIINGNDLNTSITDKTLLADRIKTILNYANTLEVE